MRRLFIALVVIGGLTCILPTTSPGDLPAWILQNWYLAQRDLGCLDYPAFTIPAEDFRFIAHPPVQGSDGYILGGVLTWGHFDSERSEIHYSVARRGVVRHEARHAILFALGEDHWECIGHECWPDETYDCIPPRHLPSY